VAKLVIGCGYLGSRVAALWRAGGHRVRALTRGRAEQLRGLGIEPVVGDVREPLDLLALGPAETVLYAVAPDRRGGGSAEDVWLGGLGNLVAAVHDWPATPRLIFISSSGVYGQTGGEEVDEGAPTCPADESGRVLERAERWLLREGYPAAVVLRFAGIYGPGRLIRSQLLLKGESVPADPDGWLNLIHVEDGSAAVVAADERGRPGETINVADGSPVRRRDFYARLAELLGAPPPRFVPPAAPDRVNRRLSNRRMIDRLGVVLRYPTYDEGLRASLLPGPDSC
jgi:nucleoside-diphosphate-sugar epimerase